MADLYKIPYLNTCIRMFAKRQHITDREAFDYLDKHKGLDFLEEFYSIEHLESIEDAVDDLIIVCQKNGGTLQ